jgi:uncharacterized protein (TIGR01777 family)
MKVAVFGGTGFIGEHLVNALKSKGWEVLVLDIRKDSSWSSKLKDCNAVVNLAGHPLFKNRWNDNIKALIHDSRVEGTKKIVAALAGTSVKVLVNASAIGIYGSGEKDCDESSPLADNFLARLCKNWEEEAMSARRLHGIRSVCVRIGVVLGKGGGALEQLLTPFKLGVGGTIGFTGSQSMSWVHVEDVVGIMIHSLENEKVVGPINATSPNIVSNKVFTKTLGKLLRRPTLFPIPVPALYLLLGEVAEVVASGQRIHPNVAIQSGYTFKFANIETALQESL